MSTRPASFLSRRALFSRRLPLALLLPAAVVALLALSPALYLLLRQGFNPGLMLRELNTPSTWPLIRNTARLLLGVCLVSGFAGTALALLVARTDLPFRRLWVVLFTLPLGVPAFVGSYAWVSFSYRYFSDSGVISGLGGATLILSSTLFPYVFLSVLAALGRLDPAQEEVSRSLGKRPPAVFARVTLPQLRHAISTGLLIIALHVLAEFGAVEMLGYKTLTTGIVQRVTILGEPESARALALVLALGAILVLVLERVLRGRVFGVRAGGGAARPPVVWRLGLAKPFWLLLCASVAAASLAVPLWVTFSGVSSYLTGNAPPLAPGVLPDSLANTVSWAGWTALYATFCALPIALLAVRWPGRVASALERATWVAHALPGVIMALALVYISSRWFYPLYQSMALLVAGYVIMYLPLALGSQQVGLAQASRGLDDVSRSLGRGPIATFCKVTLPLCLPSIAVGALLVGLDVGKELTTALLLRPTGRHSLATRLWATTEGEVLDFVSAAPYGLALLLIGAVPALALAHAALRRGRSGYLSRLAR